MSEGVNIQWNRRLVMLEDDGNQVIAHFEDGQSASGDLLIGCDEARSIIIELLPSVYGNSVGSISKVIDHNRAILGGQIDRTPEQDALLPLNKTRMVRFVGPNLHSIGVCFSERAGRSLTFYRVVVEEIEDRNAPWYQFDQ